jgi:hypothetical protein
MMNHPPQYGGHMSIGKGPAIRDGKDATIHMVAPLVRYAISEKKDKTTITNKSPHSYKHTTETLSADCDMGSRTFR